MHASTGNAVTIRFALPAPELRAYVTTYYHTDVLCSPSEPVLEDYLHPEWPNLRFLTKGSSHSAIGSEPLSESPEFSVTGPTSRAARFRLSSGRNWGIGLLPLGWSALINAQAGDYADRSVDGAQDTAFEAFLPLAKALVETDGDFDRGLSEIERHMAGLADKVSPQDRAISAINAALVDPELSSVKDLAERVGMNVRSLERLSRRAFGFTPKLLLRRQRFLRSLSRFMLDPSMKWLSTLDYQYHDQAHFVRDFKRFMGMSPSAYAKLEKPFLIAAARARMEIAGAAVQGLHNPDRDV
ncbi:helix-turn-helix domain-containing protein [Erythrobacter sp. F6033]|uniref:helix-turn-helix domain-containing protein n=1 Tax=Erythrobacter sp. F6033 TaxID=2926401 RepID=UPI001FF642FB|nr:helix-turn-helix domain-containing protein [Erythrobacter sp. F6033]MCK0127053.1 helix-turn-helix domain-containing protein [Erythrobacter sp. F6033]